VTQIILAMVEQECVDTRLVLEDPVRAVKVWSADPDLQRTAPLATGERFTALDMQRALFERARRFVSRGRAEGLVPRVREIMDLWEDTLDRLATDVSSLAGRIDWILKRSILDRAAETRGITPGGPELRYLDQIYHSLDPEEGLFWAYLRQGVLERLVSEERIDRFLREPPDDTRAYARARLLRLGGRENVSRVDWDSIRFRIQDRGYWPRTRTQELADPLAFTREETEAAFDSSSTLDELLDRL
jgi:proteasome accessory factor A